MKIAVVMGSPRSAGNTATVTGWVEEKLREQGHEVDRINAVDLKITGCTGCNACKVEAAIPGCVVEGVDEYLAYLIDADAILIASPLYAWGFSGQLKIMLDHAYSLAKPSPDGTRSLIAGKRMGFLITAAGPVQNNIELLAACFPSFAGFLQCELVPPLLVPGCTKPDELPEGIKPAAERLAIELAGAA